MSSERNPEKRLAKSKRKYISAQKAKARRDFVPSIEKKTTAAEVKAQAQLVALNQFLFGLLEVWVGQTNQSALQEDFDRLKLSLPGTGAEDHNTALAFGRFMASYLTAIPAIPADTRQKDGALAFVERIWLRFGLKFIKEEERDAEVNTFLDACPKTLQNILITPTWSPTGGWSSPLQQIQNQVFSPIAGALEVRS